jgi:hypothetical protein
MNYDAREELCEMIKNIDTIMPITGKDEDMQNGRLQDIVPGRRTPVTRHRKKAAGSKSRSPFNFDLPNSLAARHQRTDDKPDASRRSNADDRVFLERCLRFSAPLCSGLNRIGARGVKLCLRIGAQL